MSQPGADGRASLPARQDWPEQARHLARLIGTEPFRRRSWAELGFFIASSALSWAGALMLLVLGLLGLGLTAALVGLFLLAGSLRLARGLGRWQRGLAAALLGEEIAEPQAFSPRQGVIGWLRGALSDRAAWRTVAYLVAKIPLTIFGAWFALSVWLEALSGIASPIAGPIGTGRFGIFGRLLAPGYGGGPSTLGRFAVLLVGVVLLFVAPWTMRLIVYADRQMMLFLLGPDAASATVKRLEESRSRTLDAATETLRRIERDLHDGTQAQLVALAMRLGQANEKLSNLESRDEAAELEAIRRLVGEAHRGAKEAITDLRDLARGIHPPALDTGLENALATLAARSPVPTEVSVAVGARPSAALEAICYFSAAELLSNVAQHSGASRASLSCAQHGPWLRIVVRDNGRGGAELKGAGSRSSGLTGLSDRIGAVDGHMSIVSPRGGPTAITIDLPCRP